MDVDNGYLRPEVVRFAEAMEFKLRKNDHKGHWKDMGEAVGGLIWFFNRLKDELAELEEALLSDTPSTRDILLEAADVANFSMMIADVTENLFRERGGISIDRDTSVGRPASECVRRQICTERHGREPRGDTVRADDSTSSEDICQ